VLVTSGGHEVMSAGLRIAPAEVESWQAAQRAWGPREPLLPS
jgi:hypothetical protein